MENIFCNVNDFLCQYNNILIVIFCLTVIGFIVSIYTCFVKCRKMKKDIETANTNVSRCSESIELTQKQVETCLKAIELKISGIEAKIKTL